MKDNEIGQVALKRSWDLESLSKEGIKIEKTCYGRAEISGENGDIFKLRPYSYRHMQDRQKFNYQKHKSRKKSISNSIQCYNWSNNING